MTRITITVEAETLLESLINAEMAMESLRIEVEHGNNDVVLTDGVNSYTVKVERREG